MLYLLPSLSVMDGNSGLRKAVGRKFPNSLVQRCQVHKMRNIVNKLPEVARPTLKKPFTVYFCRFIEYTTASTSINESAHVADPRCKSEHRESSISSFFPPVERCAMMANWAHAPPCKERPIAVP